MNPRKPQQCEKDRQAIYDAIANRITDARVAVSKLFSTKPPLSVEVLGKEIDTILEKAQREASDRGLAAAQSRRSYRDLQEEPEALKKALEKYTHRRHGVTNDNCTQEARAALYPYLAATQRTS